MRLSYFLRVATLVLCLSTSSVFARELPEFTTLVKKNSPAVVNISTIQHLSAKDLLPNVPNPDKALNDLLKKYNEESGQNVTPFEFDTNSSGSGFILSQDGYIVTNQHVVKGAEEIRVRLSDGRELFARVVGSDERTDIALLKINAKKLPTLKMGSAKRLEVGEWVLAIGSPFGFDHSATAGIVSAKGRSLPTDNYVPFIQTDVAINPGNSGGPLFNLNGEVIGVNSQIYSRSGGFMGVSFAIPIDIVMDVVQQLKATGVVQRGWIGVYIQEVSADLADSFRLSKPQGALVAEVMPQGPAVSRVRPGDIVLSFNGTPINRASDLPPLVGESPIGSEAKLTLLRQGKLYTLLVPVAALPTPRMPDVPSAPISVNANALPETLGLRIAPLDAATRQALQLSAGVQIMAVVSDAAHRAGFFEGDIITQINGQSITTVQDFKQLVATLHSNQAVAVLVQRAGVAQFIAMKVQANARE